MNILELKVARNSFTRIPDPFIKNKNKYLFYTKSNNIPHDINQINMKTTALPSFKDASLSNSHYLLNSILISSSKVRFDKYNENVLIYLHHFDFHGIIAGFDIYNNLVKKNNSFNEQYVQIEVLTNAENEIDLIQKFRK